MSTPITPERRLAARKNLTPQKFSPVDAKKGRMLDPADAPKSKKGGESFIGLFIVAVVGVFFLAYIFNWAGFQSTLDDLVGGLYRSTQGKSGSVERHLMNLIPFVVIFGAALGLYMVFAAIMRTFGPGKSTKGPAVRRPMTLHRFVPEAQEQGVQVEIARELFKLLKPILHHEKMPADLNDTLAEDLGLTHAQIGEVYGKLFHHTAHRVNKRAIDPEMKSVLALMISVQEGAFGIAQAKVDDPEKPKGAVWVQPKKYPKEVADAQVAYHL